MPHADTQSFTARLGPTRIAFLLGKYLPPWLGYIVARILAWILILIRPPLYTGALANLSHVLGPTTSQREVRRCVRRLIVNAGRCYYDLFHNLARNRFTMGTLDPPVRLAPGLMEHIEAALQTGRGLLLLITHTSNFDLAGVGLADALPGPPLALSLADPAPGYAFVNELRDQARGSIRPISRSSLREAVERLRGGGIVVTAIDRPVTQGNEPVTFFGATAHLPTGYMRLPLMTECEVMTVYFHCEAGTYWIHGHPPLELERTGDRGRDVQVNARRALAELEPAIAAAPDQWMIFTPVWPDEAAAPS